MPRVPIFQSRQKITGRSGAVPLRGGIPGTGVVAGAIAQASQQVLQVSDAIFQQLERQRKQDMVNTVADKTTQFESALQNKQIEYMNALGKDAYNGQDQLTEFVNEQKQMLFDDVEDQETRELLDRKIQQITTNRRDDFARHETRQRRVVSESTRMSMLDTLQNNSFHNIGTIDENVEQLSELITAQVDSGQISESEGEQFLLEGRRRIAERQLAGMISRNPETVDDLIGSGIYDKYLGSKTLEHYRNQARRQAENERKLAEAQAKQQMIENQEAANKELTDGMLSGNPEEFKQMLGKYRETLTKTDYKQWAKEYQKMVDNASKSVDSPVDNKVLTKFRVQAMTGEGLETDGDMSKFRHQIGQAVLEKKIGVNEARRIINDAEDFKTGNEVRKVGLRESIQTIESAYREGLLGDVETTKANIERERAIRDLMIFAENNPDKHPSDFTEQYLKLWKDAGFLWRDIEPSPEELKRRREELVGKQEITAADLTPERTKDMDADEIFNIFLQEGG